MLRNDWFKLFSICAIAALVTGLCAFVPTGAMQGAGPTREATASTQLTDSANLARLNAANTWSVGGQIITNAAYGAGADLLTISAANNATPLGKITNDGTIDFTAANANCRIGGNVFSNYNFISVNAAGGMILGVGNDTGVQRISAGMVEINNGSASGKAGIKFNGYTTTQRNALTATEGMTVYDLTLHKMYTYDGTTWQAHW